MSLNRQLDKYLRTRAISSPWQVSGNSGNNFKAAIIIPALAEAGSLPKTLASLTTNSSEYLKQTVILVVVNNRSSATLEQKADNRTTLEWLKVDPCPNLNLCRVDASSPGLELPEKEGVGLARKIGFDLALSHLNWDGAPLLISLDADTLVDDNYLSAIFEHFGSSQCGGTALPFRHQAGGTPEQERAIRDYELYLRSYLLGLRLAGSPYAYHTIGSAFACTAAAYVAAGGMNRRLAGEDFYFLQQVAKVAGVDLLRGTVVRPSPRFSERVPFGTGRVVQSQVESAEFQYQFVPVGAFQALECWLRWVADHLDATGPDLMLKAEQVATELGLFLSELNFRHVWKQFQANHQSGPQRLRAFHHWFDALRTRQLLTRIESPQRKNPEQIAQEFLHWQGSFASGQGRDPLEALEALFYVAKE